MTLVDLAGMDSAHVYAKLNTHAEGLTDLEARKRLEQYRSDVLAKGHAGGR